MDEGEFMQTITLEIQDPEIAEMIVGLARKLNVKIVKGLDEKNLEKSKEALKIMRRIAQRGTLAKAIPDPVAWQREIRKDKLLLGREE